MSQRILAIFLVLFSQIVSGEDWRWEPHIRDDGIAVIVFNRKGYASLSEAIASVPKDVWIKHVRISFLSQHPNLQKDLHAYMAEKYPDELNAALESAGNMHNPKVIALRQAFTEAVLASGYIKSVNEAFSNRCEQIASASYEKFYIAKKANSIEYEAMLWLTTEKCT